MHHLPGALVMPDVIRHPAGEGAGGLDSCFRRNDGRDMCRLDRRLSPRVWVYSGDPLGSPTSVRPYASSPAS